MRRVISAFAFRFLNASSLPAPVGIGCLVLLSLEESFKSLVCQTWELTLRCHPEQNPIKINSPMKVTAAWCPSSTGNNFCLPSVKSFSPLLVLCYYLIPSLPERLCFWSQLLVSKYLKNVWTDFDGIQWVVYPRAKKQRFNTSLLLHKTKDLWSFNHTVNRNGITVNDNLDTLFRC